MNHLLAITIAVLLAAAGVNAQTAAFTATPTMPLGGTMVFDSLRGVVVVFERSTARTWDWDGSAFRVRLGATHDNAAVGAFDPLHGVIHTSSGGIWNGANWSQTTLNNLGSLAFDVVRQRLIGVFANQSVDVAEWDGTQWTRITPPASPGTGGSLAYDPTRGQTVLAIGNPVTLWTWDGSQWNLLDASAPALPAGTNYGLVHDPSHNRLVVHGSGGNPFVSTTLAFDANGWTAIGSPPSFSYGANLAFDGIGLLRLGGYSYLPEGVFRLEGTVWRKLAIEHPRTRRDTAIASSPTQAGILLFGGNASGNVLLDDTWVFDGDWTRQLPIASPTPRKDAGLAWSPVNQGYVLYGGLGAGNAVLTDTWLWNGTTWAQQSPVNLPGEALRLVTDPAGGVLGLPPRLPATINSQWQWLGSDWVKTQGPGATWPWVLAVSGHDPVRNVVTTAVDNELWEWDGAVWANRGLLPAYPAGLQSVTFRPDTQRMLFFSGSPLEWDGTNWTGVSFGYNVPASKAVAADYSRGRLFSFQHNFTSSISNGWNGAAAVLTTTPATAERFGYGCALGASPGLLTDGRPIPGASTFGLTAATFAPNAPCVLALGFTMQPQHLGSGCVSWIAPPHAVHFLVADGAGTARASVAIPNDNSLRGVAFLAQSIVLDPPRGPFFGLTFSDGLRITIGD